ncbi:PIG-L deacetylase family protein [Acetobacter conturbans]|uniref:PIG-L family deacetylase n=1 Tax=Acetobacter conturbans TaxID=1737472 RepID=A0ABX0JUG7_9PROT|nr:PIG-L deacetylase family protein [Acetobacter conturbans]NHN87143.1 PIG-L family deacetylase [Acetobacter conturbans]
MKISDVLEAFRNFPLRDLDDIAPGTTLIAAPHPDDESLGCGGFIAEAVQRGRPPVVVIVSDGSGSHPRSRTWPPQRLARQRQHEAREAMARLKLPPERLKFLGLRDTAVPTTGPAFSDAVEKLSILIRDYNCTNVLVSWRHDPHCDHEAVWLMGQALKSRHPNLKILAYPVWGLTLPPDTDIEEPPPQGARLDITSHLAAKRAAVNAHHSQRGLMIHDDPTGFVLPEDLLNKILLPYEIFIAS